jgi:hypothetical protein
MSLILQLGNSSNWESRWMANLSVVYLGGESYKPIPPVTVPIQFESPILAVSANSTKSPARWQLGAWLNQNIQTGLLVGGLPDASAVISRRVFLRRINLIQLPRYAFSYSIDFKIPYWIEDIQLIVHEYVGPIVDSTEQLIQGLQADITRVEQKIDNLSA